MRTDFGKEKNSMCSVIIHLHCNIGKVGDQEVIFCLWKEKVVMKIPVKTRIIP